MENKKDSLGDRMKGFYEGRARHFLTRRTPVIMRLDGRAFHTLTRGADKPFDDKFIDAMQYAASTIMGEVQGCKACYVQSDEISLLITDYDKLETEAWFGYNIQKMVSVAAAVTAVAFSNQLSYLKGEQVEAAFDARVFNIPKEEVVNYFRWRYQDWLRNSIQMLAQSLYSHRQLHCKNKGDLHEMCFQKGKNWNDLNSRLKNGTLFITSEEDPELVYTDFNLMSDECETVTRIKSFVS